MELHQLRYFLAVVEAGSFSRAAEQCHVAQPSLSQQIKKLESGLGQVLFDRLARGVELTDAGRALLPRARLILAEVRQAEEGLQGEVETGCGPLAVGAIPTMAPYLLPPVLKLFLKEYPGCRLTVHEDLTERLMEAVVDCRLDCAVMSTPVDHELLEVEVLAREKLLVAASVDYDLPPADRLTLEDIRSEPAIVVHEMHCLGQQIRDFCSAHRLSQRIVCRGNQLSTVLSLVELGLGVSLVPEMCARQDRSRRRRYVPVRGEGPEREIAVVWRSDRSRSWLAKQFVALLSKQVA